MSTATCEWTIPEEKAEDEWELNIEEAEVYDPELSAELSRVDNLISREGSLSSHCRETLDRAVEFLNIYSENLKEFGKDSVPTPDIDLGPRGSIDLYWKRAAWELLVNIPKDVNEKSTYYGDYSGSRPSRGSFDSAEFNFEIALWLMND